MSEKLEKVQAELADADEALTELLAEKAELEGQLGKNRKEVQKAIAKRDPLRLKEMELITAESGPGQKIGD